MCGFFKNVSAHSTVNLFYLLRGGLNALFSPAHFTVRANNLCNTQNVCEALLMLLPRLLVDHRLIIVKFWGSST